MLGSCSWGCESEAFGRERGRNAQVSKSDMEINGQAYKSYRGRAGVLGVCVGQVIGSAWVRRHCGARSMWQFGEVCG